MSRRSVRPLAALAALLLLFGTTALLPVSHKTAAPAGRAYLLLSPNIDEHLDLEQARQRLDTVEHAHYRQLAGHILDTLGAGRH